MVISIILLADFSLVMLVFLQLYSFSWVDVFLVLYVLPFGLLLPFPAGINALFSHGPRKSAALSHIYSLWNISSLVNVVSFSFLNPLTNSDYKRKCHDLLFSSSCHAILNEGFADDIFRLHCVLIIDNINF